MKHLILILLYCFGFQLLYGATISGKITDVHGETLPFAIVFVKGTTQGTSANAQGLYQLKLQPGNCTVVCQQMGFKQTEFAITVIGNENITHDFKLSEQQMEMKEFVLKSKDDPAKYIMRKVIAKRRYYEKYIKSFVADIYLKGFFKTRHTPNKVFGQKIDADEMGLDSNRQGILYLCEEIATYYSTGKQRKTLIHSVKESGEPNGLGFAQFPSVVNIYQNNISISNQLSPRGFISPVNDNAFFYYKFKLIGDFTENGRTIYKIKVTPKRSFEPLFEGEIFVVDNDWSLHSINLFAIKNANMELLDSFRLEQVYLPFNKDNWVIKQQVLGFALSIFKFDIYGFMTTVYNNQKINEVIPDSVFKDQIISAYDKAANKKDSIYWKNTRPIPLQAEESIDYFRKDSLRSVFEDPKRLDSIRRKENHFKVTKLLLSGYLFSGKKEQFYWRTNSLISGLLNYNTVEGINIEPRFFIKKAIDSFHFISSSITTRYGFNNAHFNPFIKINYSFNDKNWRGKGWNIGIAGGKSVNQIIPSDPIDPLFNTIATLFYRENYMKIYENLQTYVYGSRNYGNGLSFWMGVGYAERNALENTTDFSFAKSNRGGFTDNIPIELQSIGFKQQNAMLMTFRVFYKPGITYTQYPDYKVANGSKWPTFKFFYQKGIPDIFGSNVDFEKWRIEVNDKIRLKALGSFDYSLITGGFLNANAYSLPEMNHINGNQFTIAAPYIESFQLAPYFRYSNVEKWYAETHAEWHLNGFITNKIPVLKDFRWYAVTGFNALFFNQNKNYKEAFIGIDNFGFDKSRIFRIDFVQSWDEKQALNAAVRIGLHFTGVRIKLNDKNPDTEF